LIAACDTVPSAAIVNFTTTAPPSVGSFVSSRW
jgi:hypothetical protein